jgi:signal transduction histidine kinase
MQQEYQEIVLVWLAGSTILLVTVGILVFLVLFYQKKKWMHARELERLEAERKQALLEAQMESREIAFNEVARELHDNIGQQLTGMRMLLLQMQRKSSSISSGGLVKAEESTSTQSDALNLTIETVTQTIGDLRNLARTMSGDWLQQFQFCDNLKTELNKLKMHAGLTVVTEWQKETEELLKVPFLQGANGVMLLRVVQEGIQNACKHAQPSRISVFIKIRKSDATAKKDQGEKTGRPIDNTSDVLEIILEDDGMGLPEQNAYRQGMGMKHMMHRMQLLQGEINWEPASPSGTRLILQLPVSRIKRSDP